MTLIKITTCFLLLTLCGACAKSKIDTAVSAKSDKWEVSRDFSYRYEKATKRKDRLKLAKSGIEVANECILEEPNNAKCIYYRAVNTGLYYQSKVIGYQNGLKAMVIDCNKVIALDPTFAYGGAYRILAQIYIEVPAMSLKSDSVTQDLNAAKINIDKAIEIAPDYPENYITLAYYYIETGDKTPAAYALTDARNLSKKWKTDPDYGYWKKEIKKLQKKLKKTTRKLALDND